MINELNYNYSENSLFVPSREQVQTFIIDCFQALNTTGALPRRSFREYLQRDSALQKIDSGLIRDVMNAVWSRCVGFNKGFSKNTLEKVIFPALFSRNLILRNLEEKDLYRVQRKLTVGYSIGGDCILLEGANSVNKLKPYGAIYYNFRNDNTCRVVSLKVHYKKEGFKYGNLLLSAIYMQAKAKKCSQINLFSTKEGIPLYLSFGFVPFEVMQRSEVMSWWHTLTFDVKIAITEKLMCLLIFDIENSQKVSQNLEKSLNFFNEYPTSRPFIPVEIPKAAYDLGLLESVNSSITFTEEDPQITFLNALLNEEPPSEITSDDMEQCPYYEFSAEEPSQDNSPDCIDQYFLEFEEYSAS